MRTTILLCVFAFLATATRGDDRGFVTDVINDVIGHYKKSLGMFSEVATMMKNGDGPAKIIKSLILAHPEVLKNTNGVTAVCKIPTLQKIDYVGPVCTFIDSYAEKVIQLVGDNKEVTSSLLDKIDQVITDKVINKPKTRTVINTEVDKRIISSVLGDVFNEYKKSLSIFSEVAAMIKNGDAPAQIIKSTIQKHPEVVKNTNAITAVCKIPTFQKIDYVGPVCTFVDQYANKLIELIEANPGATSALIDKLDQIIQDKSKPKTRAGDRGFIGDVLGDVFNEYKKSLSIFQEIAVMMKNGDDPAKIIKTTIIAHPEVIKNSNGMTAVCKIPTLQKIEYVGPVCTFVDQYANKLIQLMGDNKEVTATLLDKIDQVITDKVVNKPKTRTIQVNRNVVSNVLGDVFTFYKKQLGIFQEIYGMVKNGDRPAQIIKTVIHTHPEVLKNTNAFTGVCKIQALHSVDYVGPVCKWIDTQANDLIEIIDQNKGATGALIDRIDQIYG